MSRQLVALDADNTIILTVETENEKTQMNADLVLKEDNMAVYFRPNLFEFLFAFLNNDPSKGPVLSHFELGLFTKGTQSYADPIIKEILDRLKKEYNLTQTQVNRLFKVRLYREDLNDFDKDLSIFA